MNTRKRHRIEKIPDSDDENISNKSEKEIKFDLLINDISNKYCKKENDDDDDDDEDDDEDYNEEFEDKCSDKQELKRIKDKLKQDEPTLEKVVSSKISFDNKCKVYELYNIYIDTIDPAEKMVLRDTINRMLKETVEKDLSKELTELESKSTYNKNICQRILQLDTSDKNKIIIYDKYQRYLTSSSNELSKYREWIEYALRVPQTMYNVFEDVKTLGIETFLKNTKQKMDVELFGMNKAKNEILMTLHHMITNPNSTGHAMAIVGVKGCGKTQLVRSLASSLNLPFEQISLGGVNDASFINGHSFTYEGATPGIITKKICNMKYKNGILFFDEFDKLAHTDYGIEASNCLLHITDFTQNSDFRDKYLDEFSIDLSHMWFIYAMNDENCIDSILRDRIPIIYLNGYSQNEKLEIAKKYLIPKINESLNLKNTDVIWSDENLKHIIFQTQEGGVRKLKDLLTKILKRLSFIKSTNNNKLFDIHLKKFDIPFYISNYDIDILLDNKKDDDDNNSISKKMMYL